MSEDKTMTIISREKGRDERLNWMRDYIDKLRNIQLTEADYNGGLKFMIGRKLRNYCESNGSSSEHTFGGRNGKNCIQMLKDIQLENEVSKLRCEPQALVDIDAVSCFDNMATNVIGLAIRRIGGSKEFALMQTKALISQEHRIRTKLGVSEKSFTWAKGNKLGGSGQGSGASMINWHSFNEAIIKSYKMYMNGTRIEQHEVEFNVRSFVDDNKLIFKFKGGSGTDDIIETLKRGLSTWSTLLKYTGGELSLPKCYYSIGMSQYDKYGQAIQQQHTEDVQILSMRQSDGKEYEIQRINEKKGTKLLGVYISVDRNCNDEYENKLQQSQEMAARLQRMKTDRYETFLIYNTRYKPKLHYSISITLFTQKQCNQIQSNIMSVLLPKMGLNRHTPRAVVFAPRELGGMGLIDFHSQQTSKHIEMMMKHISNNDVIGKQ